MKKRNANLTCARAAVNVQNRYGAFSMVGDLPLKLEEIPGFVMMCTPGLGDTIEKLARIGFDRDYIKRVRRKLAALRLLHTFYRSATSGCHTVVSAEPINREVAQVQFEQGLHVLPCQRDLGERFIVTPEIWISCRESFGPRFSKSVAGAYVLMLKEHKEYWSVEEMQALWRVGRSKVYKIVAGLVELGFLKKIKSRASFKFVPEKAYRPQFEAKVQAAKSALTATCVSPIPSALTPPSKKGLNPYSLKRETGDSIKVLKEQYESEKVVIDFPGDMPPRLTRYRYSREVAAYFFDDRSPASRFLPELVKGFVCPSVPELKCFCIQLYRRLCRGTKTLTQFQILSEALKAEDKAGLRIGMLQNLSLWRELADRFLNEIAKKHEENYLAQQGIQEATEEDVKAYFEIATELVERLIVINHLLDSRNGYPFVTIVAAWKLNRMTRARRIQKAFGPERLLQAITGNGISWALASQNPEIAEYATGIAWKNIAKYRMGKVKRIRALPVSRVLLEYSAVYDEQMERTAMAA